MITTHSVKTVLSIPVPELLERFGVIDAGQLTQITTEPGGAAPNVIFTFESDRGAPRFPAVQPPPPPPVPAPAAPQATPPAAPPPGYPPAPAPGT